MVLVSESEPITTTATSRQEFASVVAALEQATGRRLGNPQRRQCFEAFATFPNGVREVARTSLEDARVNPLGLFSWRIANGWHELDPLPPAREQATMLDSPSRRREVRGRGSCFVCERSSEDALWQAGQWWCSDHEAEAA